MKRQTIGYREILAGLLAIPSLGDADRRRITHILESGRPVDEARLARELLEQLASSGALRRTVQADSLGRLRVVFSTPEGYTSYSLPAVARAAADSLVCYSRPLAREDSLFTPEVIRALLSLSGRILTGESRLLAGPAEAIGHALTYVRQIGRAHV